MWSPKGRKMQVARRKSALLGAMVALVVLVACQSRPIPRTPTPLPPAPVPPTPISTAPPAPTPTPSADMNVALKNTLGPGWKRAEVVWSPDSRFLAVTFWADMAAQTYVVDSRTGESFELTTDEGNVGLVAWSPDGKRIAGVAGDDMDLSRQGVWSFAGGRTARLLDGPCEDLAWAPDGKTLVATCELVDNGPDADPQLGGFRGGGQLWRVDADGNNARRLIDLVTLPLVAWSNGTAFDAARYPIWSPDGKQIAFEARSSIKGLMPEMAVGVMGANGESARLVVARPVWLGGWLGSDRLIVRSHTAQPSATDYTDDFYAADLATEKLENLTRSNPSCEPLQDVTCKGAKRQVSLDADYFGLASNRTKYFYRAASRSEIIGGKADKDWLVVNTYPPSDLTLEQSVERTELEGERLGFAAWLNDGRLAYVRYIGVDSEQGAPGGSVRAQFVVDGKLAREEDIGTWDVFAVGWATDGRRVAVATDFGVILYGLR
jgi:dipeptidyl aminopeptidase/acylaminoacyl peptidase